MKEFTKAARNRAIEAAASRIAFPDVEHFGELFESIELLEGQTKVLETFPSSDPTDVPCRILDYCAVVRGVPLRVTPTQAVIDALKARFSVPGSDIAFFCVRRGDGSVLVTARLSQFISSYWLALVFEHSVPHQSYSSPEAGAIGRELFT